MSTNEQTAGDRGVENGKIERALAFHVTRTSPEPISAPAHMKSLV
jgi:hypothetical protein